MPKPIDTEGTALGMKNSVQRQRRPGAAQQREQAGAETDSQAGDQRVPGGAAEGLAEMA